ncbi:hypothetical protein N6H18_13675 [Reichenbachiella agarivorans]|uniref:DUF5723 domain-containing protein n=1 Tax=Reichenbachiella agarivorans TaxID=2979464 RepID=A0ABY6CLK1_9BACT|nr:hypothetical protein [Reichenbachiella agarivorans]UXP31400.1 hypothetical protein N6H18_13675 [Reichenbachiella agarivorans]
MRKIVIILGIVTGIFIHRSAMAQDSQYRWGQISFVPGFGTSLGANDSITNYYSFNILGGNQYALQGFELGGLFNFNQHKVTGVQVAGLINKTGTETIGLQVAGLTNINEGQVSGAQIAGLLNKSGAETTGMQAAGLSNLSAGSIQGMQVAGLSNWVNGEVTGVQASGLINKSSERVLGAQVAGLLNLAPAIQGIQISGLSNKTDSVKGVQLASLQNQASLFQGAQISGLINTSGSTKGAQLSGLVNKTGRLNGFQLGIINIADSVEAGAQLGIINIVKKKGMFEFGVAYGDVIPWNLSLRTGTNQLYSILSVGSQFDDSQGDELWSYGFGLGSKWYLKDKVFTSLEIVSHELRKHQDDPETLNLLNSVQFNFGYQFFKHLSVTAGPVLNIYVAQMDNSNLDKPNFDIANKPFYEHQEGNYKVQMWAGYALSIRF